MPGFMFELWFGIAGPMSMPASIGSDHHGPHVDVADEDARARPRQAVNAAATLEPGRCCLLAYGGGGFEGEAIIALCSQS